MGLILPAYHSEPSRSRALDGAAGSLSLSFLLVQLFILRTTLPIRGVLFAVFLVSLFFLSVPWRRVLLLLLPVAVWSAVIAIFSNASALLFFSQLGTMVLAALLFSSVVSYSDLVAMLSGAAARSTPLLSTLLLVFRSLIESIPTTHRIVSDALTVARVRGTRSAVGVYAAALRQSLITLLAEPDERARVYAVRRPDFSPSPGDRFFRNLWIPVSLLAVLITQELLFYLLLGGSFQ